MSNVIIKKPLNDFLFFLLNLISKQEKSFSGSLVKTPEVSLKRKSQISHCIFLFQTAALLSSGMVLFCGTCYYIALTNDRSYAKITPFGGSLLIFGWLSFIL